MKIGVLAVQGDFIEHINLLQRLGAMTAEVRLACHLVDLDGLIIPGGESTTIGKLSADFGLIEPLREFAAKHAIWGTCAGAIFLSKTTRLKQPLLGVMDIRVARNAFGRQRESFETELPVPVLGENRFPAVFIRAPIIEQTNNGVEILARLNDGTCVAARQGKLLVSAFHPELTSDLRFHQYFLDIVAGRK